MKFDGRVRFRSSTRPDAGPPGEAEVQRLNPQRAQQILNATGWNSLEPGSLNLTVDDSVLNALLRFTPALTEDAANVQYPAQYQHIPKLRKAYYYYAGTARVETKHQPILVRRAHNPVPRRVELFAAVSLKDYFAVWEGDAVTVEIDESN